MSGASQETELEPVGEHAEAIRREVEPEQSSLETHSDELESSLPEGQTVSLKGVAFNLANSTMGVGMSPFLSFLA